MIWYLFKSGHNMAIHPRIRAWLRSGLIGKILTTLVVLFFLGGLWEILNILALLTISSRNYFEPAQFNLFGFLAKVVVFCAVLVFLFPFLDNYIDTRVTRNEIKRMESSRDVMLATRGEYIGGHPMLPHGRFVYLTLGGTLQDPQLKIILPQPVEKGDKVFSMPVLDVEKTQEKIGEAMEEVKTTVSLASVSLETQFIGPRSVLQVEYIGKQGRRHQVEFGHFFYGDGEVQDWRNHIVCIQSQAETGDRPYGPWKDLPVPRAKRADKGNAKLSHGS